MTVELGIQGPMFHRWLPIGLDNGIRSSRNGFELLLWLDTKSVQWASEVSEEVVPNHVNLTVHRIYADITTITDDAELLSHMSSRDFSQPPNADEELLAERYEIHGKEVFSLLQVGLNRFLTFIGVEKGQYWVDPLKFDLDDMPSLSVEFRARAQVGDGSWFRWQPTQRTSITVEVPNGEVLSRFLTQIDWPEAQTFVSAGRQPDLTRQLLAGAEALANSGSERVALTEAVAALEVALSRFTSSPKADALISLIKPPRFGLENLGTCTDGTV